MEVNLAYVLVHIIVGLKIMLPVESEILDKTYGQGSHTAKVPVKDLAAP